MSLIYKLVMNFINTPVQLLGKRRGSREFLRAVRLTMSLRVADMIRGVRVLLVVEGLGGSWAGYLR